MRAFRISLFVCSTLCIACGFARSGEEHMPLAGGENLPVRVNVIKLVLPAQDRHSAIDDMTAIPGIATADLALRDKRIRDAAREAALAPPEPFPFATRPGKSKTRPERIHLPPPVASEPGFVLPGFNPPPSR